MSDQTTQTHFRHLLFWALLAGCGGENPYQAAESANTAVADTVVGTEVTGDTGIALRSLNAL